VSEIRGLSPVLPQPKATITGVLASRAGPAHQQPEGRLAIHPASSIGHRGDGRSALVPVRFRTRHKSDELLASLRYGRDPGSKAGLTGVTERQQSVPKPTLDSETRTTATGRKWTINS
jgi:hypothetical protein